MAKDEFCALGDGGEKEVYNGTTLEIVRIWSDGAGKLDANEVSDRLIDHELLDYELIRSMTLTPGPRVLYKENTFFLRWQLVVLLMVSLA